LGLLYSLNFVGTRSGDHRTAQRPLRMFCFIWNTSRSWFWE